MIDNQNSKRHIGAAITGKDYPATITLFTGWAMMVQLKSFLFVQMQWLQSYRRGKTTTNRQRS